MTRRVLLATAILILGMVVPVSPAAADPIKITGGSAVVDEHADASVHVQGQQGFHAQFKNLLVNSFGPWVCGVGPCLPGTILSPLGFIESIDGAGTVAFRGASYDLGATNIGPAGPSFRSGRPAQASSSHLLLVST